MIEKSLVQEAVNKLVSEGQKITVANTRRKMIEIFGFAGNNNDLAPLVKEIKKELRDQAKGEDIDETIAIAIRNSTTIEMPSELEAEAIKFIRHLYQETYNSIDSEVDNERIKQLEQENEILRNQNTEYPKLKTEFEIVQRYYKEASEKLIETNRLLELQKVAEGKAKVEEMNEVQKLYEETSNQVANLKTTAEYATQRKNEFSKLNAELREELENKNNRIKELEDALISVTEGSNNNQDSSREEYLENRVLELSEKLEKKNQELSEVLLYEAINIKEELKKEMENYLIRNEIQPEIERNKSKVAKFINKFLADLKSEIK